jgi:hypothetical protein
MDETGTCSICGGGYITYGNNPDPFPEGRACHECDNRFVTPARMLGVRDVAILTLLTEFARRGRSLVWASARARALFGVNTGHQSYCAAVRHTGAECDCPGYGEYVLR